MNLSTPAIGYGINVSNYEVIIDQNANWYELVIKVPSDSPDSGTYECSYFDTVASRKRAIMSIVLNVMRINESVTCNFNALPALNSNADEETEVVCTWTNMQPNTFYFDIGNGEVLLADIQYFDRIITRESFAGISSIDCILTLENNEVVTTPCSSSTGDAGITDGVVRVDPFVGELPEGSNATFSCTSGNLDKQSQVSWHVTYPESGDAVGQERLVEDQNLVTILHVQSSDQSILIECRVPLDDNTLVSSFASLRVVEATTPLVRRPPGESQTNRTTIPTTPNHNNEIAATQPLANSKQSNGAAVAAAVIILIIVLIVSIVIAIFIVRRKQKFKRVQSEIVDKESVAKPIQLQEIPHTAPNGSSQLYALSFKDKKSKRHHSADVDLLTVDETSTERSPSSSNGILSVGHSGSHDQIYAEPEAAAVTKSASLPFLDVSEYETISVKSDEQQKSHTLSTSSSSTNSNRRWTSQRMKKGNPGTPPRARHALSFRAPTASNPDVSSEYTKMTINRNIVPSDIKASSPKVSATLYAAADDPALQENKAVREDKQGNSDSVPDLSALYAKPDKRSTRDKKPSRCGKQGQAQQSHNEPALYAKPDKLVNRDSSKGGRSHSEDQVGVSTNNEYAEVCKVVRKPSKDDPEITDTYLSSLPGPFSGSFSGDVKGKNKSVSLHRETSTRSAPPKPLREKCQSEFIGSNTYSVVSDYEIMSKVVKETDEDNDYDECGNNQPVGRKSEYDHPNPIHLGQVANTLPRINETTQDSQDHDYSHIDDQRSRSMHRNYYSSVCDDDGAGRTNPAVVPPSPQYADINEAMYASVDDGDENSSDYYDSDFD